MPFFIKPPVTMAFKLCSFSGWNCWFSSLGIDIVNKLIAVISFVGQYLTPVYVYLAQHWKGEGNIVFLPFANHQVNRITVRIDYGMDFLCWLRFGCVRFCLEAPFSLFYHEGGEENLCFVHYLFFKYALVYTIPNALVFQVFLPFSQQYFACYIAEKYHR